MDTLVLMINMADESRAVPSDSPEARRYNRIRRWLGVTDFLVGFAFLIVLLATGWSGWLRDLAYRAWDSRIIHCRFSFTCCCCWRSARSSGLGLEYYGFRLERRFQLSNQKFSAWAWDEVKGFLVGVVLGSDRSRSVVLTIRQWPQHWWMLAWALFMGLFILLAQLAPVILFPIFYKFEPLDNEELRRRLVVLSERAGHAGARRLSLEAFGKKQEGQCRSDRAGRDPPHHSRRHFARQLLRRTKSKPCWPTNSGTMCIATF